MSAMEPGVRAPFQSIVGCEPPSPESEWLETRRNWRSSSDLRSLAKPAAGRRPRPHPRASPIAGFGEQHQQHVRLAIADAPPHSDGVVRCRCRRGGGSGWDRRPAPWRIPDANCAQHVRGDLQRAQAGRRQGDLDAPVSPVPCRRRSDERVQRAAAARAARCGPGPASAMRSSRKLQPRSSNAGRSSACVSRLSSSVKIGSAIVRSPPASGESHRRSCRCVRGPGGCGRYATGRRW